MTAWTDSADSSLQVGPPRQAASPQPTRPPRVSIRTKAKFIVSRVVNDMRCGRLTGMSARTTRTSPIVRSLGIRPLAVSERCVLAGRGRPGREGRGSAREARGVEEREVHGRLAVDDPGRDVAAGGGRVLEPVAAEP